MARTHRFLPEDERALVRIKGCAFDDPSRIWLLAKGSETDKIPWKPELGRIARKILGISERQYKRLAGNEMENCLRNKVWDPFRRIKHCAKYRWRIVRFKNSIETKNYPIYEQVLKKALPLDKPMLKPFQFQPPKASNQLQPVFDERKASSNRRNIKARCREGNGEMKICKLQSSQTFATKATSIRYEPMRSPAFISPKPLALDVWALGIIDEAQPAEGAVLRDQSFEQARGAVSAATMAYNYRSGGTNRFRYAKSSKRSSCTSFLPDMEEVITISESNIDDETSESFCDPAYSYETILRSAQWLDSATILRAMKLIRKESRDLPGLLPTEFVQTLEYCCKSNDVLLQILHCEDPGHWCTISATNIADGPIVSIFDSNYPARRPAVVEQIASLLRCKQEQFKVRMEWCPSQSNNNDCGLHAIANLTEFVLQSESFRRADWRWNENLMRQHLLNCINQDRISQFPKLPAESITPRSAAQNPIVYEVYCICRQPRIIGSWYGRRGDPEWVVCARCSNCFHSQCVNSLRSDENFTCIICRAHSEVLLVKYSIN